MELLIWLFPVYLFFVFLSSAYIRRTNDIVVGFAFSFVVTMFVFVFYYVITQYFIFNFTHRIEFPPDSTPTNDHVTVVKYPGDKIKMICVRDETTFPDQLNDGVFDSPEDADSCILYIPKDYRKE